MKKTLQKIKKFSPKIAKYFFDFLVVFIGVFLAFWLNERNDKQKAEAQKQQIYLAIYEDLNSFYLAGREENEEGFINLFENNKNKLDSLVSVKKLPATFRFRGDYWNIEVVQSLIESGHLKDINIEIFKGTTRFHTLHKMFLTEIEGFNEQYEKYISANYEDDADNFYKPGTNELKDKFKLPFERLDRIVFLSKMLVDVAKDGKKDLNEIYKIKDE